MKESGLALVVYVFLCASFASAQHQHSPWREYVFAEDGFAITLPEAPHPHADAALPGMTAYTVSLSPNAKLSLRVSHQDRDCSATLDQLRDGGLKGKSGIDPASVKEFSLSGHPGLEYQYKLDSHRTASDRFYCVKGRFYTFSASWPSTQPRPSAATRIVSSFRLLSSK